MAGAYTTYVLQTALGTGAITLAFGLALPVAFLVAGTLGLILEFLVIRRLYGRPLDTLLVTWGVGLMLQQLARDLFGAQNVNVSAPSFLDGGVTVFDVSLSYPRLFIIGVVCCRRDRDRGVHAAHAGRAADARGHAEPPAGVGLGRAHDARGPHDVLHRLGPGRPGRRRHDAARPGRPDARPELHHRRVPRRDRRRSRPAARRDPRGARARHGELVHRVQHDGEHRQGGRVPAHRAVPAVATAGHDRPAAPRAAA